MSCTGTRDAGWATCAGKNSLLSKENQRIIRHRRVTSEILSRTALSVSGWSQDKFRMKTPDKEEAFGEARSRR